MRRINTEIGIKLFYDTILHHIMLVVSYFFLNTDKTS